MPQMFIERRHAAISEAEWRRAVEGAGARFAAGSLDVELRDKSGDWRRVLHWESGHAFFSVMDYYDPLIEPMRRIATALQALIVDNDGAVYWGWERDPAWR